MTLGAKAENLLGQRPRNSWLGQQPAPVTLAPSELPLDDARHIYRDRDGSLRIRGSALTMVLLLALFGRPAIDVAMDGHLQSWSTYVVEIFGALAGAAWGIFSELRKFSN